ncbi:pyruvate kinase [Candidatus Uabimicrobium amorphum]|uniref:Pyruvate kinase n=1 Tax=Uabimicrobium amorphum TaxID=2596890 RepID=A0A5S9IUT8_UABAM|nr:pyruvate kinase [Candidatus Uabimicrobium amorphum]BBM87540.1 pyruvate kinase [Candidatus Uabimicrobium amorphum]
MRLTKIVATVGPASNNEAVIRELITAGVNVVRLNFSHGTHEEHRKVYEIVRKIAEELNKQVAILQDLSGPKIRIGMLKDNRLVLRQGENLTLTNNQSDDGTDNRVFVNYDKLYDSVQSGTNIFLADGNFQLTVVDKKDNDVICKILTGGTLHSRKGVNLPQLSVPIPCLTPKDKEDLKFGLQLGVDIVALSFVQRAEDIQELRQLIQSSNSQVPIVAKIEKPAAIDNIDRIIDVTDGIMVARGDLAVELSMERVPILQKQIINKARNANVPVIVATQMLETMVENQFPTRAEVADVANAIFDGTDAVMLSAETAAGKHPAKVVKRMVSIIKEAEKNCYSLNKHQSAPRSDIQSAVSSAAVVMAEQVNAKIIVAPTASGMTPLLVAQQRLGLPILALSYNESIIGKLALTFAINVKKIPMPQNFEQLFDFAHEKVRDMGVANKGDYMIIIAGHPFGEGKNTNLVKAMMV